MVERYSYDVFGEPNRVSGVGNPYMFTGRRYDSETELYYYRARYYNPHIGRFLQTDPVGYEEGLNLYTYCQNNPINFVDPYGLGIKEWFKKSWIKKFIDWLVELIKSCGPAGGSGGEAALKGTIAIKAYKSIVDKYCEDALGAIVDPNCEKLKKIVESTGDPKDGVGK
jgi:RHS repeat-associated protein